MTDRTAAASAGMCISGAVTALGIVYGAGIVWLASTGTLSPGSLSVGAQSAAGLATLVVAQLILALSVCVDRAVLPHRRLYSQLCVVFSACFAVTVSINRYVQLAVVRPAQLHGNTEQLSRFLPYEPDSAMFAVEILGWGVFLGLALFSLAPAFRGNQLESRIRWACIAYAVFSLLGAAGYAIRTQWFALGFVAWGLILYVWTGMLMVWFRGKAAHPGMPSWPQPRLNPLRPSDRERP